MKRKITYIFLILVISIFTFNIYAQRFPAPEFEGEYKIPQTQISKVQPVIFEYLDIFVFLATLSFITWVIIKKRSRRLVFWISIFSLLYFGFYRKGCICPVGSLQNVSMAIFHPEYAIPVTAIIFFIAPLGFTLFFGRTFCAGVCPLGAIQDIIALRPVSLKPWIRYVFGLIPFIYLGLAVLYAATGTDFIICRYDPFVEFFRHSGSSLIFGIGSILLVTGVFIARPYCRFFCPYGVLLNLVSRVSRRHLSIANGKCINCRLCESACPFDAIDKPTGLESKKDNRSLVKKMMIYGLITPVLILVTGWSVSRFHGEIAHVNFKVRLAEEMMSLDKNNNASILPDEIKAFQSSGSAVEELYAEAASIVHRFYLGSWILGGFIGLVFGLTLARLTIFRYRNEYLTNKGNCYSCVRCVPYCPVK
jgi:polyferredoxin